MCDIVLIALMSSSEHKLLLICDVYATEHNILYNAVKSKFASFVQPNNPICKSLRPSMIVYWWSAHGIFRLYPHLGHIITILLMTC